MERDVGLFYFTFLGNGCIEELTYADVCIEELYTFAQDRIVR
jgi:hypothetical protein